MSLHEYLCIFSAYYDSPVMSPGNISGFLRVPLSSCAGEQLHPQKNRFGSSAVNIKRISFLQFCAVRLNDMFIPVKRLLLSSCKCPAAVVRPVHIDHAVPLGHFAG